jgi:hypothetical protein
MQHETLRTFVALTLAPTLVSLGCGGKSVTHQGDAEAGEAAVSGAPSGGSSASGGMNGVGAHPSTGGSAAGARGGTSTGGAGSDGAGGSGGSSGAGFTKSGICGERVEATVNVTDTFDGLQDFQVISEESVTNGMLDEYVCLIRFQVARIGRAPEGCVDLDGATCDWSHLVELKNPVVVTDVNGACANNELRYDATWIAQTDGSEVAYGYISGYEGHGDVVMRYHDGQWNPYAIGYWFNGTGEFESEHRAGYCRY